MNFYDLYYKFKSKDKFNLVDYRVLLLSTLFVINLGICQNRFGAKFRSINSFNSISNDISFNNFLNSYSQDYVNELVSRIDSLRYPENIDFSDFPYSDGSVESQVNIARYIRDKVSHIPNVFKYDYILEHWLFTPEEFNEFYAVIYLEGKPGEGAYELAFANVTNVFDRVISRYKSAIARIKLKVEGPISLYQHITAPGQYSPFGNGSYLDYIGFREEESYQAVLDSLFVMDVMPERMHDYLDFVANGLQHTKPNPVQLIEGGNWFSFPLPESDILPLEERYYYVNQEEKIDQNVLVKSLR